MDQCNQKLEDKGVYWYSSCRSASQHKEEGQRRTESGPTGAHRRDPPLSHSFSEFSQYSVLNLFPIFSIFSGNYLLTFPSLPYTMVSLRAWTMSCSLPQCQNEAQCRCLRNICWVSIWGNGFEKQVPYGWYRWHLLMLLGVPGTRGSWNTSPFPEHRMRWMEKNHTIHAFVKLRPVKEYVKPLDWSF